MPAGQPDIDAADRFLSECGFGRKTGIEFEGELLGVPPSRGSKRERFQDKWYLGDSISAGIGQGYNAFTPVQQAEAIATIANDGRAFRPHLVRSIENVKTGAVRDIAPELSHTVAVKPEHLAVVKNALIGVAKEGTGARAFVGAQYVSAGKTGTSQLFSLKGEKDSAGHLDERL